MSSLKYNDEQTKNALYLVTCNLGKILPEDKLDNERLLSNINEMFGNLDKYHRNICFTPLKDTVSLIMTDIYHQMGSIDRPEQSAIAKKISKH